MTRPAAHAKRSWSSLLAAAVVVSAGAANADSESERLFTEGQRLLARGEVAGACKRFEQSYASDAAPGTLMNMAFCHEKLGKYFLSWLEYRRAYAIAIELHDKRAAFAKGEAETIAAKLPAARVLLSRPLPNAIVRVDGIEVPGAISGDTFPLEPGTHSFQVVLDGTVRATVSDVRVDATQEHPKDVLVAIDDGAAAAPVPAAPLPDPVAPPGSAAPAPEAGRETGHWIRPVSFAAGGAGALIVGVGAFAGVRTFEEKSEASSHCKGSACDPTGKSAGDSAHAWATASNVLFVAGAALVASAVVLYVIAPTANSRLAFGPGSVSLLGVF